MDTLYEILSSGRRRRALGVLTDADEPLSRDELARRIAVRERNRPRADDANAPDAEEVDISLGHVHLPKLEDAGLVDRTEDDRYDATARGYDVERASRAFENALGSGQSADDSRPSTTE